MTAIRRDGGENAENYVRDGCGDQDEESNEHERGNRSHHINDDQRELEVEGTRSVLANERAAVFEQDVPN